MCKVLKSCTETYGKFCNKDDKTATITAARALQAAKAYLKQQKTRWIDMSVEDRESLVSDKKKLKNFALGLANVSICSTFWSLYFDMSAVLCFKRDWIIGNAQFRNTWSAGWFVDILKNQKSIDLTKKYVVGVGENVTTFSRFYHDVTQITQEYHSLIPQENHSKINLHLIMMNA